MKNPTTVLTTVALITLSLVLFARCTGESTKREGERGALTALTEPETALSEELMLTLGQAKNFHHKADVFMSDGKLDQAAEEVRKILDIPFPNDAPESEDALLDTRARLAKMRIAQGQLEAAMTLVDQGIASATRESFFLANLHTVRGEVFEAEAALAEPGSDEARRAKLEAIGAFDSSIQINTTLLKQLKTGPQP